MPIASNYGDCGSKGILPIQAEFSGCLRNWERNSEVARLMRWADNPHPLGLEPPHQPLCVTEHTDIQNLCCSIILHRFPARVFEMVRGAAVKKIAISPVRGDLAKTQTFPYGGRISIDAISPCLAPPRSDAWVYRDYCANARARNRRK
jgi:hypothetical protein